MPPCGGPEESRRPAVPLPAEPGFRTGSRRGWEGGGEGRRLPRGRGVVARKPQGGAGGGQAEPPPRPGGAEHPSGARPFPPPPPLGSAPLCLSTPSLTGGPGWQWMGFGLGWVPPPRTQPLCPLTGPFLPPCFLLCPCPPRCPGFQLPTLALGETLTREGL